MEGLDCGVCYAVLQKVVVKFAHDFGGWPVGSLEGLGARRLGLWLGCVDGGLGGWLVDWGGGCGGWLLVFGG